MQIFWCRWQNEVIERSVHKQRAGIVMKREVMYVSSKQTLLKGAVAWKLPQLGGFLDQWLKLQAGVSTTRQLGSATNLTVIQKKVSKTVNPRAGFDEFCYPDFRINIRGQ